MWARKEWSYDDLESQPQIEPPKPRWTRRSFETWVAAILIGGTLVTLSTTATGCAPKGVGQLTIRNALYLPASSKDTRNPTVGSHLAEVTIDRTTRATADGGYKTEKADVMDLTLSFPAYHMAIVDTVRDYHCAKRGKNRVLCQAEAMLESTSTGLGPLRYYALIEGARIVLLQVFEMKPGPAARAELIEQGYDESKIDGSGTTDRLHGWPRMVAEFRSYK